MEERKGGEVDRRVVSPRWTALLAACLAVLAIDQATKAVVRSTLAVGQGVNVAGPFAIAHLRNPGIAGGGLAGWAAPLALFATAGVLAMLAFLARNGVVRPLMLVGFGLLIGGGLGNALDRVRFGYVTDFILRDNRAYNVADFAIFLGTMVVVGALVALLPQALSHQRATSGG